MSESTHAPQSDAPTGRAYETQGVRVGWLATLGGMLALLVILAAVLAGGMFKALEIYENAHHPPAPPMAAVQKEPTGPRLRAHPYLDLWKLRASEKVRLTHYGWVDREDKIVHIPISRAIDLLAKRGLPARKQAGGTE